jgi:copper chaperone NosL
MQYIVLAMMAIGIVIGLFGNRWHFWIWVVFMIVLGSLGLYDFYIWEYNYGHTLDPAAAIKVPGMAYQPPFIGRKEILNFIAYSFPAFGGYAIGISIFLAGIAALIKSK